MRTRVIPDPESGRLLRAFALLTFALCAAFAVVDLGGCVYV